MEGLSIIICSRKNDISIDLRRNIESTIGANSEIVVIDNSLGQHSIFSAYNTGASRAQFNFLCFVHEDVLFRTEGWGKNIIKTLKDESVGVAGVAGGCFSPSLPSPWYVGDQYINIIQHNFLNLGTIKHIFIPENYTADTATVVLLDGVLLAMRKDVWAVTGFDEGLAAFHAYDMDISIHTISKGYRNVVMYDVLLEHFSNGNFGSEFWRASENVAKKWSEILPIVTKHETADSVIENASRSPYYSLRCSLACILRMERKQLNKFLKRKVRSSLKYKEIKQQYIFFLTNMNISPILKCFYKSMLPISVGFISITSKFRNK